MSAALLESLGAEPEAIFQGRDYIAVFASQRQVAALQPNLDSVAKLDAQGVVVTAPGSGGITGVPGSSAGAVPGTGASVVTGVVTAVVASGARPPI